MDTRSLPQNPPPASSQNLLSLNALALGQMVTGLGWPRYRTQQILRWLYQRRVSDIQEMTDLSQAERQMLQTRAYISKVGSCRILSSEDGTRKFLSTLEDGVTVESVLIPDADRLTLCLSTQVGCTLDCGFCLTGTMGLIRNLRAHEIVGQVLMVQNRLTSPERVTNIVLMGMGEPLANFDAVSDAITRLTNRQWGLGVSPRRITLSTAGLASRLQDVAALGINMAVSLNASTEAQREQLMPAVNRVHPLKTLLAACRRYPLPPRRRLTFEYVLLSGVNDTEDDARRLTKLVRGIRCKVNLIPFNEFPGSRFKRPSDESVASFQAILRHAGIDTYVRKSKGRDVLGACGQLGRAGESPVTLALTQIEAR